MITERNIMENMFNCRFGIESNETPETSSNKRELSTAAKIGIYTVAGAGALFLVSAAIVETGKAAKTVSGGVSTVKEKIEDRKINKAIEEVTEIENLRKRMKAAGCSDEAIAAYIAANYS
jgi:hypothetical protein